MYMEVILKCPFIAYTYLYVIKMPRSGTIILMVSIITRLVLMKV